VNRNNPLYCKRHKLVETNLGCSKCGDLICPDCLVYTPVGARCSACALIPDITIFSQNTKISVKYIAFGGSISLLLGFIWAVIFIPILTIPFLPLIMPIGIAYLISELLLKLSNHRPIKHLDRLSCVCIVITYSTTFMLNPAILMFVLSNMFFTLMLIFGVLVAINRVRI
jgi:hypothetical protein